MVTVEVAVGRLPAPGSVGTTSVGTASGLNYPLAGGRLRLAAGGHPRVGGENRRLLPRGPGGMWEGGCVPGGGGRVLTAAAAPAQLPQGPRDACAETRPPGGHVCILHTGACMEMTHTLVD